LEVFILVDLKSFESVEKPGGRKKIAAGLEFLSSGSDALLKADIFRDLSFPCKSQEVLSPGACL